MKEVSIVYQNADYAIRYRKESRKIYPRTGGIAYFTTYEVFFDDARLKEQFGDPFEFAVELSKEKLEILFPHDGASWHLADVIIKSIPQEETP